jgi:hypothetical protein
MLKALVFKELREIAGITIATALAYGVLVAHQMGYRVLPFFPDSRYGRFETIPFLQTTYIGWFICISAVFASVLGLWQTVAESGRGTWLFLLHRPMDRKKSIGVKMAVGLSVYLIVSATATLTYAAWAAVPGAHASPFYWWMTEMVWPCWLTIVLCYLGAFLAGIRPGRWIGTRLLPLAAAGLLAILIVFVRVQYGMQLLTIIALILVCAFFVGMILYEIRTRDFS